MEKELLLLRKLHTNPELSQRDMAKATGISLGGINTLIKELAKNGTINIEKSTHKTMNYSLTSLGLSKKAESMYRYVIEAYSFLKKLSLKLDDILKSTCRKGCVLVLFGYRDELYEYIEEELIEKGWQFKPAVTLNEIRLLSEKHELLVVVWQPENINIIKNIELSYVNLLDSI